MKNPRIKRANLCRAIIFLKIILIFTIPIVFACSFRIENSLLNAVVVLAGLVPGLFTAVYVLKNYTYLMMVDFGLSMIRNHLRARKSYIPAGGFSETKILSRAERFGKSCEPVAASPRPESLRYRSNAPMTVWSSGIERIIAVFRTDILDRDVYLGIISSARANSKALKGRKKHRFLDKTQKGMDLDRITVIIILAKAVDGKFGEGLRDRIIKDSADGKEGCLMPCVIDLACGRCVFDGIADPFLGFGYPVKNRGLRMIRKMVFGGKLPLSTSPDAVELPEGWDAEESLWHFLRREKKELVLDEKNERMTFEGMKHGDVIEEGGCLIYVKFEEHGLSLWYELNGDTMTATVDEPVSWSYPKSNLISNGEKKEIYRIVDSYFAGLGYTVSHGLE